jgi:hypothetical protein
VVERLKIPEVGLFLAQFHRVLSVLSVLSVLLE